MCFKNPNRFNRPQILREPVTVYKVVEFAIPNIPATVIKVKDWVGTADGSVRLPGDLVARFHAGDSDVSVEFPKAERGALWELTTQFLSEHQGFVYRAGNTYSKNRPNRINLYLDLFFGSRVTDSAFHSFADIDMAQQATNELVRYWGRLDVVKTGAPRGVALAECVVPSGSIFRRNWDDMNDAVSSRLVFSKILHSHVPEQIYS